MNSSNWQTLCYISLIIGVLLFASAAVLAVKFRVISIIIYERKARKKNYEINESKAPDIIFDVPDEFYESTVKTPRLKNIESEQDSGLEDEGEFTVVVNKNNDDDYDGTVVVGKNKPETKAENDFVIISKIVVTSAAADEIEKL